MKCQHLPPSPGQTEPAVGKETPGSPTVDVGCYAAPQLPTCWVKSDTGLRVGFYPNQKREQSALGWHTATWPQCCGLASRKEDQPRTLCSVPSP